MAIGTLLLFTKSADSVLGQVNKYQPAFQRAGKSGGALTSTQLNRRNQNLLDESCIPG